ncbi:MAG: hypothetical protein M3Z01_05850 [Thermoproteota archaeon]|nr:hypothetical protein [Thermoproteota archaeon]
MYETSLMEGVMQNIKDRAERFDDDYFSYNRKGEQMQSLSCQKLAQPICKHPQQRGC